VNILVGQFTYTVDTYGNHNNSIGLSVGVPAIGESINNGNIGSVNHHNISAEIGLEERLQGGNFLVSGG
jgi:hypothetical protein